MSQKYKISAAAEDDLTEILCYIAQDSLMSAYAWLDKLYANMDIIADAPLIGHYKEELMPKPYRFWPVGRYLILYTAEPEVEIHRVVSAYRDLISVMR